MGSSGSESKVVENGVVNSVEGPPLETFVTAADELPTRFAVGGSSYFAFSGIMKNWTEVDWL